MGELVKRASEKGLFTGQWPVHLWDWFIRLLDRPYFPWFDLGNSENRDDVLQPGLRQAVDYLKKEFGPDKKQVGLGRVTSISFQPQIWQAETIR